MANVGTPKYKDLLNNQCLEKLKTAIQNINTNFKLIANDTAVSNREDTNYVKYMPQYFNDLHAIMKMRANASEVLDMCDEINFMISKRALENHVHIDNEEDNNF